MFTQRMYRSIQHTKATLTMPRQQVVRPTSSINFNQCLPDEVARKMKEIFHKLSQPGVSVGRLPLVCIKY